MLVARALEEPLRQIAINAGVDGSVAADAVKRNNGKGYGYNVVTNSYGNMAESGIIDPKVTRSALQNAASIASMALTTKPRLRYSRASRRCSRSARYGRNVLIPESKPTAAPERERQFILDDNSGQYARIYCQLKNQRSGVLATLMQINRRLAEGPLNFAHIYDTIIANGPKIAAEYDDEEGDVQYITYSQYGSMVKNCASHLQSVLGKERRGEFVGVRWDTNPKISGGRLVAAHGGVQARPD